MGRSKAQDALMAELIDIYPLSYITDEVYIGELVEEQGYTLSEIQRELGHKPHKMFVDIVMKDSDRTVAFEYHGEQHYSLIGNMTKTTADLLMNQQLDQEKSWILERIGIPLVVVPFDMYIDASVIEHLIDEAYEQLEQSSAQLTECPECGRRFPQSQMPKGACKACIEKAQEQHEENKQEKQNEYATLCKERVAERREARKAAAKAKREEAKTSKKKSSNGASWRDFVANDDEADEYREAQKEKARKYRKQKYQEWKNSPEYAAQQEEAKRRRKEAYQKQKEKQKAERAKQKLEKRRHK